MRQRMKDVEVGVVAARGYLNGALADVEKLRSESKVGSEENNRLIVLAGMLRAAVENAGNFLFVSRRPWGEGEEEGRSHSMGVR